MPTFSQTEVEKYLWSPPPTSVSTTHRNRSVSGRVRCEREAKLSYVAKLLTRQIRVMYKDAAFSQGRLSLNRAKEVRRKSQTRNFKPRSPGPNCNRDEIQSVGLGLHRSPDYGALLEIKQP